MAYKMLQKPLATHLAHRQVVLSFRPHLFILRERRNGIIKLSPSSAPSITHAATVVIKVETVVHIFYYYLY